MIARTRGRWARPPRGRPLAFRVRVVGGEHDGQLVTMRPPLPARFERDGVVYRIDRVAGRGHIALVDQTSDHVPVLAWRAWSVEERPGAPTTLTSGHEAKWSTDGPLVAECHALRYAGGVAEPAHPGIPAPQFDCDCGIYCTTTLAQLRTAGYREPDAYGLMAIWGRIEEHELGYRAQRAYPQAILVNSRAASASGFSDAEVGYKLKARASDLGREYRVPAVLAMPERAIGVVSDLIQAGRLPAWAAGAAPADVRLHRTLAKLGKLGAR